MLLVAISGLELELNNTSPLYVQVSLDKDEPSFKYEFSPREVTKGRLCIAERHQITLTPTKRSIDIHVYAQIVKQRKFSKEITLGLLGRARIPIAGRVLSTSDTAIVRQRNQPVALRDETGHKVGGVTLLMIVVKSAAPSPPKNFPTPRARNDKSPSPLIVTELETLLSILRKIEFPGNIPLLMSLPLLDRIRENCSRQGFSHCDMEFSLSEPYQGNVIDDLVTQLISHLEFLRDVALPFIRREQRSEHHSGEVGLVLRYAQDMLISLFDASVVLYSWVDTYSVAAYQYFMETGDDISKHAFSIMHDTMKSLSYSRYMALRRMYPNLSLGAPDGAYKLETLLVGKVLDEIVEGKSDVLANTLYSFRYKRAQRAMEEIQRELKARSNDERPQKRDILRRMLTHVAQNSNSLPSSLLVTCHLEEGSRVDAGSYGVIHCARMVCKGGGSRVVALKQMPVYPRTGDTVQRLRQMYLEVLSCQSLSCKNVVKILGIYQRKHDVFIVMDYFPHGNTLNYRTKMCGVRSYRNGRLVDLIHKWMFDLASGLRYLHEEGIIHGDIRGVNLLVDNSEALLITDFGLSVFANGHSQQYLSRRTGNAQWMAPEIMERTQGISLRPTKESDVYSFSHTCIELFTGKAPYEQYMKDTRTDIRDEIVFAKRRPPLPTIYDVNQPRDMSRGLYKLLTRCWTDNPGDRLTMDTVTRLLQAHDFSAIYSESALYYS